jgi:hypothetical protein
MGATAGLGMQGFGAGFSAMGNLQAGKAQKQLNDYNAQVSDMEASDAIARGALAEKRQRQNVKLLIGSQRAGFAAGGVDVNDGSAVDVQADTARQGELDALTIRLNAAREAWGFKNQATDFRVRGDIAETTRGIRRSARSSPSAGTALYQQYGFGSTTRTRR